MPCRDKRWLVVDGRRIVVCNGALLDELSAKYGKSKGAVVREALVAYSALLEAMDSIESPQLRSILQMILYGDVEGAVNMAKQLSVPTVVISGQNINIDALVKSVANEIKESIIEHMNSISVGAVRISLTSTERLRLRQLLLDLSHTLTYLASQIDSNPDTVYRVLENKLVKELMREVKALERRTKSDIAKLAESLRGTEDERLARAVAQLYSTLQLVQDLVKIPTTEERRKQLQSLKRQLAITAQIIKELN